MRTRCFALAAALALGCGARTVSDDYRDAGNADRVVLPDVEPDRRPPEDQPVVCPTGQTRCGDACVDLTVDLNHCGACGVACGPDGVCTRGTCLIAMCLSPFVRCNGTCVNTGSDPAHCGACNRACPVGQVCFEGMCASISACPPGRQLCGGDCVDLATSPANCGACGNVCVDGRACVGGSCVDVLACPAGQLRCNGLCTSVASDPANCGRCGVACAPGQSCTAGACVAPPPGRTLRIDALLTSNCRVTEHEMVTGDDRGGIAFAGSRVFYTGDNTTVAFDAESLGVLARGPRRLDGIFGEVSLGLPFTLASNTTPLDDSTSIVDALLQVSADGTPGRTAIPLRTTAFINRMGNEVGIFAGALRAVVTQGTRAWVIDGSTGLASPSVTALTVPPIGPHTGCESWAIWGVAEFFEGQTWLVYVRDGATIVRQNLLTGAVMPIATFPPPGLGDMCSITVAPSRNRWYFHHEAPSFARNEIGETLGYCDARISTM